MINSITSQLKKWNELKTAKTLLDTFLKYASTYTEYDILGQAYNDIKDYMLSIYCIEKVLLLAPDSNVMYAARANLAKVYNHANLPQKALDCVLLNERKTPKDYDVLLEKSFSLFLLNRKSESFEILTALHKQPNLPETVSDRVNFNLATHKMYAGEYKEGLSSFVNSGSTLDLWQSTNLSLTKWDGITRPGSTVVIYAKGGIGDEIINVRFYENIKQRGMIPLWYTDRSELREIFSRHGILCISDLSQAPTSSYWAHAMSLPIILDLDISELQRDKYLEVNTEYDQKWRSLITSSKIKLGLRWAGNMEYDHDLHRGLPIVELYNQIQSDSYEYYSLQRDDGADQTKLLEGVIDLQPELNTFEDALAALNQLDIFVTSCTSLAHAAAALGKRVIVLVPITAYYVWIGEHWYSDNVTVLFQSKCGCWKQPIEQLQKLLK